MDNVRPLCTLCQIEKTCFVRKLLLAISFLFFITQLFHKFDNHTIHSLWLFLIIPPKSDKNKSNPEKHAELSENWANNLPLKNDDHACIERNKIVFLCSTIIFQCAVWKREDYGRSVWSDFWCILCYGG